MTKWSWWLSWIVILGLGIFLRFWQLGEVPTGTYWDETAILLDAKSVALTGRDIHGLPGTQTIFPSYGDYKLPVYIWLATASVKLFGATAWALRLPSALLGVASIILAAGLVKVLVSNQLSKLQNDLLSLLTGLVVATSPWSIQFSRTAFEGHSGQFFLGLSIYLWLKGAQNIKLRWLSGLVGALAVYCYYSVRFVWPVVLAVLVMSEILITWQQKLTWKKLLGENLRQALSWGVLPLIIFGVSLLPLLKSPLAPAADRFRLGADSILNLKDWPVVSNQYREMAGNAFWTRLAYHRHWLMARELLQNYADHLNLGFLFLTGDPNLRHGTGQVGLFFWWGLPALLAGLYWWAKSKSTTLLVLGSWWLAALLPASVPETTPHALRSLNALLPLSIIIGAGLFQLHAWWWHQSRFPKLIKWSVTAAVTTLALISLVIYQIDYFNFYPLRSAKAWQTGYGQLAENILSVNTQGAETWIAQGDDKFFLWLMLELDLVNQKPEPWLEKNYQFYQLGQYHFELDWKQIKSSSKPTLLVIQASETDKIITSQNLAPSWIKEVMSPSKDLPSYSLIGLNWPEGS